MITFTQIAAGKYEAKQDGLRISSALIVGGRGVWALQSSSGDVYGFRTKLEAAQHQLAKKA